MYKKKIKKNEINFIGWSQQPQSARIRCGSAVFRSRHHIVHNIDIGGADAQF